MGALLSVDNLRVEFKIDDVYYSAVEKLSFSVNQGETLGIVGESGCGKSATSLAIMGLLQKNARVSGRVEFQGRSLFERPTSELRRLYGNEISMVFQDSMNALNPVLRVGDQIAEGLLSHRKIGKREALLSSIDLLDKMGLAHPSEIARMYPHELSGGMRQRVMIAMAMACEPKLLIADEPTTALDVTVQAQILRLIKKLTTKNHMGTLFITHDLGVIAQMCDRVAVMYAGRIVEHGSVKQIFHNPCHPYTEGLLKSVPRVDGQQHRLESIPGNVPPITAMPPGCKFKPRCSNPECLCRDTEPDLFDVEPGHQCRTWQYA